MSMQLPIFQGVMNAHPLERSFANGPPDGGFTVGRFSKPPAGRIGNPSYKGRLSPRIGARIGQEARVFEVFPVEIPQNPPGQAPLHLATRARGTPPMETVGHAMCGLMRPAHGTGGGTTPSAKWWPQEPKTCIFLGRFDPSRHFYWRAEGGRKVKSCLTSALFWPSANTWLGGRPLETMDADIVT